MKNEELKASSSDNSSFLILHSSFKLAHSVKIPPGAGPCQTLVARCLIPCALPFRPCFPWAPPGRAAETFFVRTPASPESSR